MVLVLLLNCYYRVDLQAENPPAPRTDHVFIRSKDAFYVYGGRDETRIFSDIHEYNISTSIKINVWL